MSLSAGLNVRLVSIHNGPVDSSLHFSRNYKHSLPRSRSDRTRTGDQTKDYATTPPYIALSYAWGKDHQDLICDDALVRVSANLPTALKQLNQHFPGRLVWTDSLCIDQNDVLEKTHQVTLMGRIFSRALTVAVWLGDGLGGVATELEILSSSGHLEDEHKLHERRISLLAQLSQVAWFYRAWTFQEIRLARRAVVLLGSDILSWETFIDQIQAVRRLEPSYSTATLRSVPHSYSKFQYASTDRFFSTLDDLNEGATPHLSTLLFLTWYREATIKHDKVYSLLASELSTNVKHGIEIDYTMPWNELCIKTARACINVGEDLEVLKIAGMIPRWKSPVTNRWDANELSHLLSHPSWAPDWWSPPQQTRSSDSFIYDERGTAFQDLTFCCPIKPPQQDIGDRSPFLILRGVFLGLINLTDEPTWDGGPTLIHPAPQCAATKDVAIDPEDSSNIIPTIRTASLVEDVDRHLQGDLPSLRAPQKLHFPHSRSFPVQHFPTPSSLDSSPSTGTSPRDLPSHAPAQVLASSVESGDYLVLLEGGGLPFILRPVKDIHGRIPKTAEFSHFFSETLTKDGGELLDDAALFVLVGEASMCWDRLWPRGKEAKELYCRAGRFVIV